MEKSKKEVTGILTKREGKRKLRGQGKRVKRREREREREREGERDRDRERETERERQRQTDRQTDRQKDRHRDREIERGREGNCVGQTDRWTVEQTDIKFKRREREEVSERQKDEDWLYRQIMEKRKKGRNGY